MSPRSLYPALRSTRYAGTPEGGAALPDGLDRADLKTLVGLLHDLKNKLGTVRLTESQALDSLPDDPAGARELLAASQIDEAVDYCRRLEQTLSRESAGSQLQSVSLAERFETVRQEVIPGVKKAYGIDIVLTHDVSPGCRVYSSFELAKRVGENIVMNAHRAGATRIWLHYAEHEYTVTVRWSDNGRGMSQSEIDALGFGYSNHGGGQGIGIVRDLVHEAGGLVTWRSLENLGTECRITLRKIRD